MYVHYIGTLKRPGLSKVYKIMIRWVRGKGKNGWLPCNVSNGIMRNRCYEGVLSVMRSVSLGPSRDAVTFSQSD